MRGANIEAPTINLSAQTATLTRVYDVITPIFGGGATTQTTDPHVIRGSSIRGHLRFWWRATRGGGFADLAAMRAREMEIWGAAAGDEKGAPSSVSLLVKVLKKGKNLAAFSWANNTRYAKSTNLVPPYAAFPLQSDKEKRIEHTVRAEVSFELSLYYPPHLETDVMAALWAWETFGGIGGRTRRGFGALQPKTLLKPFEEEAQNWLRQCLQRFVVNNTATSGELLNIPRLATTLEFVLKPMTWSDLIGKYQRFRQMRHPGKPPKPAGRSFWSEPDEIRRLTGQSDPKHKTPLSNVHKFPRAQFGLPIIFHFESRDDPSGPSLEGTKYERLGSPMILRPIELGGKTYGLAVILETPRIPPSGLRLKNADNDPLVEATLTSDEARELVPLKGEVDPLKAFLKTL